MTADANIKTTTPGKPENNSTSEMIRLTKVINCSNRTINKAIVYSLPKNMAKEESVKLIG